MLFRSQLGRPDKVTGDLFSRDAGNTILMTAKGSGIGGRADDARYVYRTVTGDFTLTARLTDRNGSIQKTGLMMRASTAGNAQALALTLGEIGGRQTRFGTRAKIGDRMTTQSGNDYTWIPVWFRLQRIGDRFIASQSSDGITWFEVGSSTVPMSPTYLVGFSAAAGKNAGENPTALFDHITIGAIPPPPPAAPVSLAAKTRAAGEVELSWQNAANNQTGFKVEASSDNVLFYEITDLPADARRFVNTGLRDPAALHYRVRAYNTGGYSAYSDVARLAATP